tara:strand:+ start:1268 stop:1483 length:216 start_codon:yes stop_codon:yes gene_type:complete
MTFEMPKDFDPYRDLVELKTFATTTDTHLANLLKNEKEICKAINQLSDNLKEIKERMTLLEKVINEIARQR